ncbi:8-oxo-dGTP diphosphatase [Candidatus Dojkabacteria bacterium]|nr:8-oxo-dGTP diphosphatase [Candidatus Dojkabacteria bacterium]
MRKSTLCYLQKDNKILLTYKKRGFGKGRMNGFGGKSEQGESVEQCIEREGKEEIGITILDYYKTAILEFTFPHNRDWDQEVHVYFCQRWEGKPKETEEVIPIWMDIKKLDYTKMWSDDIYWFPMVLDRKLVKGKCEFDENQNLVKYSFSSANRLD